MEQGTQIGPIVNSIEGSPNRYVIQKALCVVTRGFDNQKNLAVCNYSKVTNTLKLTTGNKAVQPVQNMFNGYVINSTEALYKNDMDYATVGNVYTRQSRHRLLITMHYVMHNFIALNNALIFTMGGMLYCTLIK